MKPFMSRARGMGSTALWLLAPIACGPGGLAAQTSAAMSAAPETTDAIHRLAEVFQRVASLPGFAIALGDSTGIVVSHAVGMADLEMSAAATPRTRWRVGSVSKSFTAAGAALLAQRRQLDLDAPISSLLPAWSSHPAGAATPRQIAGHLAGIRHYRDGEGISLVHYDDVLDALDLFADDSLEFSPGTGYGYSTYGYSLLSAAMQTAAGAPFLAWMSSEVFAPLGMRDTGPDLATGVIPKRASFYEIQDGHLVPAPFTDNSYKWAGGGFLSTPEDMVRFGRGLLEGRLLDSASVAALFTSQVTSAGDDTRYGMGFRPRTDHDGRAVVHHGGSAEGGRAFLLIYPREGVVVALAANRSTAPLFEEEAQTFAHFLLDHGSGDSVRIDDEATGAWPATGTLGSDSVGGSLRLWTGASARGVLEWGKGRAPIHVVLVDRHGDLMRVVGVGPHGVMNAWLRPYAAGWTGTWEYLGRSGELTLEASANAAAAGVR